MFGLLSTMLLAVLATTPVKAERSMLCDDGGPLDITCSVLNTVNSFTCGPTGVLALQAGCYLCVDATTCLNLGSTLSLNANGGDSSLTLPKANGNDLSVILNDQAVRSPEEAAFEQAAVVPNANTAGVSTPLKAARDIDTDKSEDVSNWLFVIPVTLAIVSLGLAIRNRVPPYRRGFKQLQDKHRRAASSMFHEDINPFCTSEEDLAIETAGHFEGDQSSSDGEEATFLAPPETEEEEFAKAEAEAIKQAVLLHIKEFDENEYDDDEVEV